MPAQDVSIKVLGYEGKHILTLSVDKEHALVQQSAALLQHALQCSAQEVIERQLDERE